MAYTYEELLKMGAKPVENTSKGLSYEELLKMGAKPVEPTQQTQPIEQRPVDYWNEGLKVSGKENFGELVGKGFANIPSDVYRMGKGLVYDLPKMGIQALGAIGSDIVSGKPTNLSKVPAMAGAFLESTGLPEQSRARFNASVDVLSGKRTLGDVLSDPQFLEAETKPLVNLSKTVIESPVQSGLVAEGLVSKVPALKGAVQKTAGAIESGISKVGAGLGGITKTATSQLSGLSPKTIETIGQYPEEFKIGKQLPTREGLGENVFGQLSKRLDELKSTGKEYAGIRKQSNIVSVPENFFENKLAEMGVSLQDGKIVRSPSAPPISASDAKQLEDFISVYGKSKTMNPAEFLNTRQYLDDLAQFGVEKTDHLNRIARQIRHSFNEVGQDKIDNLTKLDARFADEMTELSKVKKDYFNFDGTLKDGAVNKLANLTGKGKDRILERLENIIPDVRKQIDLVKAVEDFEAVKGQKVGTYIKAGIAGGGLMTGNPIMIAVGALGLSPELTAQLIKAVQIGSKATATFLDNLNNLRFNNFLPKPSTLKMRKGSFTPFEDINPKKANSVVGEVGDLTQEARKYKSAEEFVKEYYTPSSYNITPGKTSLERLPETGQYHGAGVTNLKSIIDSGELKTSISKLDNAGENVVSLSGNRGIASSYGPVFELKEPVNVKEPPVGTVKGDYYKGFEYRASENIPLSNIKSVTLKLNKSEGLNTKIMWDYSGKNPEYISAKELGQIFSDKGIKVFFDDGSFGSKSQLTDIWNKANKLIKR